MPARREDYPELLQDNTINVLSNINVEPQIISDIFLEGTLNWLKIKGEYSALGGEKYIMIGNFKDDDLPLNYLDVGESAYVFG